MGGRLMWGNDNITLVFAWGDDSPVCLAELTRSGEPIMMGHQLPIVEILAAGTGHWVAGDVLIRTTIGHELRYRSHAERGGDDRDALDILLDTEVLTHSAQGDTRVPITVTVTYELPHGSSMFRTFATIANTARPAPEVDPSRMSVCLESVTSFVTPLGARRGAQPGVQSWTLLEGDFDWLGEGRWRSKPLRDVLPLLDKRPDGAEPKGEHAVVSTGTWSTGKHATVAFVQSRDMNLTWVFQVEHNGAWRWEIGESGGDGYIAVSGPTSVNHSWSKTLLPGDSFTSVPASAALASSSQNAIGTLTGYRRAMRARHRDDAMPKTVFNDYMNTLNGDPTTDKLLPLIDAAAEAGVEVFCIDCGWYDDSDDWWSSVGAWEPSTRRFPHGIAQVIDAIRNARMVPGIWIEPESVGIRTPIAGRLPDSAFFRRNGRRVVEQERYMLDLRDKDARRHLDQVIDKLVDDYGIGYLKFDCNLSSAAGTDAGADSAGDGLLGHNRAYSAWIDGIHARFPDVLLENCSSGGMREDFAQTSRFQLQSTSDQSDYRLYPPIAATAPLMMLPEQAGNWAYPQPAMDLEECAFTINTTMLGHFFLSGYLNRMSARQRALIHSGIAAYKRYVQPVLSHSTPFWPLGLPQWDDRIVALGIHTPRYELVTVWTRGSDDGGAPLSLPWLTGSDATIITIFPHDDDFPAWTTRWDPHHGVAHLQIPLTAYASRTFAVIPKGGDQEPVP